MINIRDLSLRCGRCLNFMTLAEYATREGWNVYTFQCDAGACEPASSTAVVEIPIALDEFAQAHPACGGSCGTR